jgi:glucose/arabinose dehydrogenase
MTSVKDGGFYGWPYSYFGQNVDPRVKPQRPDLVAKAIVPDYALSSHVAPLGIAFYTAQNLPAQYQGGVFIGEHGSWNRYQFTGYKVIYVPFKDGRPSGKPEDVVTGFLQGRGRNTRSAGGSCRRQDWGAVNRRRRRRHDLARHRCALAPGEHRNGSTAYSTI